jgi:hypothetical protein
MASRFFMTRISLIFSTELALVSCTPASSNLQADPATSKQPFYRAYCGAMCASGAYSLLIKDNQGSKEIPDSPKGEWMSRQDAATSRETS